jgi:hypothetical protein
MAEDTLSIISKIDSFVELHEFMEDEDLDEALSAIVKLTTRPDIPQAKAIPLIVKLEAIAAKMKIQAAIYTTIKKGSSGTPNAHKKNIYYSTSEALSKLVDALKYSARY